MKRQNINVTAEGGRYSNALQAVPYLGQRAMVQILLDAREDTNDQGGCYGNTLSVVSCHGHEMVAQILLVAGADINAQGVAYNGCEKVALPPQPLAGSLRLEIET